VLEDVALPPNAACGSEPLDLASGLTSIQGNVADGYLENARVCLDLNDNRTCDEGEPTDTTDAQGTYRLGGLIPRWLDEAPIIAEVIAGATINHEDGGAASIDKAYILSTPPRAHRFAPEGGRIFISPLTTMVHERLINAPAMTIQNAADYIRRRVATGADLFDDYIARQSDSADGAEYARLHRIGRITAVVLGDQMDRFAATAAENGFSYKTASLYAAALRQVQKDLDDFADSAGTDAAGFDPEQVVADNAWVDSSVTEIRYMLEIAGSPAVAADSEQAYAEGLYDVDLFVSGEDVSAEYTLDILGAERAGGAFELERSRFRYDLNSAAWVPFIEEELQADYHFHLTPAGWVRCDPTIEQALDFQGSDSFLWTDVPTNLLYDERLSVRDISGLSINAFLYGYGISVTDTATFPEGSFYYAGVEIPRQDIYTIYPSSAAPLQGPLEGLTSVSEIPERVSLPSLNYEIAQVMGEEILILYFSNGSADAPGDSTGIIILREGELWLGYLDFAGVPLTYSAFNRTALDAMTAALTAP
jgi:hypothetical protein